MQYPISTLATIINPGEYWVVSNDKEHVDEVKELEEIMKREMCFEDTSGYYLNCQMFVAVENRGGRFQRGVIKNKLSQDLYEVLLIDYGEFVLVEKSNIKVITNKDFMKVEPLAFIVKLYGLIPAKYDSAEGICKPKALPEWTPEAEGFIYSIFRGNHEVVVQNILIQQRTVYGDLFVKPHFKLKFTSLRKLLHQNEFCVYSVRSFLTKQGLNISIENEELKTRMEVVEKWQKENFGDVQKLDGCKLYESVFSAQSGEKCKINSKFSDFDWVYTSLNQTSSNTDSISGTVIEKPKIGMGRGNIKHLVAEMKNKGVPLNKNYNCSQNNICCSPFVKASKSKLSLGRGQLLEKYLELKKSVNIKAPSSVFQTDSGQTTSDRLSFVEKFFEQDSDQDQGFEFVPKSADEVSNKFFEQDSDQETQSFEIVPKLAKAVIEPGDFSEMEDSKELTEQSLSTENGLPPLVRTKMNEKKCGNSLLNKDSSNYYSDLKKFNSEIEKNSESSESTNKETIPLNVNVNENISSSDESACLNSFNAQKEENFCWETNVRVSEQTSNLINSDYWNPYVLFHDSMVEPVKSFKDLPIQPSIIKNLEKGGAFSTLSQVQRWAIPAIRKQHNTVLIGSSKTGKTLSYIIPLIDYVLDECYFEELPQGNGPSVVIIASSSRVCESIYYMCQSLLGNFNKVSVSKSKVKIILAHGGGCEKETWVNLTNGCDILISTPHCLVRLLKMPVLTNFERLMCLVLDEIDIISQNPFRKTTRIILENAQFSTKDRHYQKIFCGRKWTSNLESLMKAYMHSYALIICSYCEAIIYEGLKPVIYLVDQHQKADIFIKILKDKIGKSKILTVCERKTEACNLHDFLTKEGIHSLLAHENVLCNTLKESREIWKSSTDSILIATDEVLNELNITEAQTLIHYSLPRKSKTNFYLRYSTLKNFLPKKQNFLNLRNKSQTVKLQDIILVDDKNQYQLPHIVDFVTRLGGKISPKILKKCEKIRRVVEVEKSNSSICSSLLAFGRCRNSKNCTQRHAFVKARDSPDNLPNSGWINFIVLQIHDASCFSAKLVKHIDTHGKVSKFVDHYAEFSFRLSEFFKSESNQRLHGVPNIGDVCAVQIEVQNQKIFYRAKVIEYLKVNEHNKPLKVSVKLLDLGNVWTRKNTELYELPEDFSMYPPTAVDMRIVGVQPMDFDVNWNQFAHDFTERLLTQKLEKNQYWSGKIVLALNNTLFLDPVERKQFLPQLDTHVFDLVVQKELLDNGIAVVNPEHLPSLLKLCAEGDIEMIEKEIREEDLVRTQPQWAFFDLDLIRVKFLAAESTSTVFLQVKKFEKLLQELEEDCQKEGTKLANGMKAQEEKKSNSVAQGITVGMFCLALFEDGWNRGRVESEKENEFYVFFVDHGDFLFVPKSDVVPIPQALLLRLPCQAIECSLVGIQHDKEYPLEVLEEIYSFSEDGKKDLYAFIVSRDLPSNITEGRKYSLNLLNEEKVSLNKILVDCGMVLALESEKENLNVEFDISDDSDDEKHLGGEEEEQIEVEEEDIACTNVCDEPKMSDNSWANYFNSISDDLFENEDSLEFLKEFASRAFPFSADFQDTKKTEKPNKTVETKEIEKTKKTDVTENAKKTDVTEKTKKTKVNSSLFKKGLVESCFGQAEAKLDIQRLLKLHKNRRKSGNKWNLKNRERVLTPQVLWCQNQLEIQIKIMLGNVKDYNLECSVENVSFRCLLEEKFYAVDLKLYGPINPQMTKITFKAFHVLLALTKLAFPLWPRLHADEEKHRWIHLDVESLVDKEGIFSDKIRSAKLAVESGVLKEGIRNHQIRPYSESEDSDGLEFDFDSDDSQNFD